MLRFRSKKGVHHFASCARSRVSSSSVFLSSGLSFPLVISSRLLHQEGVSHEGFPVGSPGIEVMWLVAGDHDLKPLKASGFSHEQHLEAAAVKVAGFLAGLE